MRITIGLAFFILLSTVVAFGRWIRKTAVLTNQVGELRRQLQTMTRSRNKAKLASQKKGSSLAVIAKLRAQINDHRPMFHALSTENESTKEDLASATKRIAQLETENTKANERADLAEKDAAKEKKRADQAEQNSAGDKQRADNDGKEIALLKGQLDASQGEVQKLKQSSQDCKAMEKELATAEERIETLESDTSTLNADKQRLRQNVGDEKEATNAAKSETEQLKKQAKSAQGRISSLEGELKQLKTGRQQLDADLETAKDRAMQAETKAARLQTTVTGKDQDLSQLQANNVSLKSRIESMNSDLEIEARAMANTLIESVYDKLKENSDRMSLEMDTLQRQNASLQSQLNKACKCKRSGDSKDDYDDDGDDENDDDGLGKQPHPSERKGTDDGPSSSAESSKQGAASMGNGKNCQAPEEPESYADGLSSQALSDMETSNKTSPQAENTADGLSSQDQPADDADLASMPCNSSAGNESATHVWPPPTKCPLGSPHQGCTTIFIPPPGYVYGEVSAEKDTEEIPEEKK